MGEGWSHSAYQIIFGSQIAIVMMINYILNIFELRSGIMIIKTNPTLPIYRLDIFFIFQFQTIDLHSCENIPYLKSILHFLRVTVNDRHVHLFSGWSEKECKDDAAKESIIIYWGVANYEMIHFFYWFFRYLVQKLSKHNYLY